MSSTISSPLRDRGSVSSTTSSSEESGGGAGAGARLANPGGRVGRWDKEEGHAPPQAGTAKRGGQKTSDNLTPTRLLTGAAV